MNSIEVLSGFYKVEASSKDDAKKEVISMFLLTYEDESLEKNLYEYLGDFDVKVTDILESDKNWYDVHFQVRAYSYSYYSDNMLKELKKIMKTGVGKETLRPLTSW